MWPVCNQFVALMPIPSGQLSTKNGTKTGTLVREGKNPKAFYPARKLLWQRMKQTAAACTVSSLQIING